MSITVTDRQGRPYTRNAVYLRIALTMAPVIGATILGSVLFGPFGALALPLWLVTVGYGVSAQLNHRRHVRTPISSYVMFAVYGVAAIITSELAAGLTPFGWMF